MSRARDLANGITTLAPLASPDFTGTVDLTGTTVNLDNDQISGDKVSGGTIGAGTFNGTIGGSATFPSDTIIKATSNYNTTYTLVTTTYNGSPTNFVTVLNSDTFTVKSATSSIFVFASLNLNYVGGTTVYVKLLESTSSLSHMMTDYIGASSQMSAVHCLQFEHSHGQSVGASLTYSIQLALRDSNSNGVRLNDYYTAGQNRSYITTFEVA